MVFGFTILDPVIVIFGTLFALFLLARQPTKLLAWLPAGLTVYFFIPTVTLLTLWQTIPILLTARLFIKGRVTIPPRSDLIFLIFVLSLTGSAAYSLIEQLDTTRTMIRVVYYAGIFSIFFFVYETLLGSESYTLLIRGLVLLGIVLSVYGAYQLFAIYTGLPYRGIVRGVSGAQQAFEYGIPRINSLASEPKRLGYVLFVSGLACFFYPQAITGGMKYIRWVGIAILALSLFCFAGSYLLSIVVFALVVFLLYPSKASGYAFIFAAIIGCVVVVFPELGIFDAIRFGYERRLSEVQIGLDGTVVYRQEFFAFDYLLNNPSAILTGVGLGQYFSVLHEVYGYGAGYDTGGGILPVNSLFLEMILDLGLIATTVFYFSLFYAIYRLRTQNEHFLCLALLFLLIQSFTIINMLYIIMLFAASCSVFRARIIQGYTKAKPVPI